MKKVLVFGTFDLFHPGHQDFLWQAWSLGNHLTVVVSRDINVQIVKKHFPVENEAKRLQNIQEWLWKNNISGEVWLGNTDLSKKYAVIEKVKPSLICFGYDQQINLIDLKNALKEYDLKDIQFYRLRSYHPEVYKSSLIE